MPSADPQVTVAPAFWARVRTPFAFESIAEERAYQQQRAERFWKTPAWLNGVAIVAFLLFAPFDHESTRSNDLVFIRFYLVIPALALMLGVALVPRLRPLWEWQCGLTYLIAMAAVIWINMVMDQTSPYGTSTANYALNMILLLVTGTCLAPVSIPLALVIAVCTVIAYTVSLRFSQISDLDAFSNSFNVIYIALSCGFVAVARGKMLRVLYREQAKVHNERNTLEVILSTILPPEVVLSVQQHEKVQPKAFGEVTILFADLVGFTALTGRVGPMHLFEILDRLFSRFDEVVRTYGLEKVKTIGDAYMVVGGAKEQNQDVVGATVRLAFDMINETRAVAEDLKLPIDLRVGIHLGSVIGGVIGTTRMAFDYWGDTVNLASRLESNGLPGKVQVSEPVYLRLQGQFPLEQRRTLDLKGKGMTEAFVLGRAPA